MVKESKQLPWLYVVYADGHIRFEPAYFEFVHSNGKTFQVDTLSGVASAMAKNPFVPPDEDDEFDDSEFNNEWKDSIFPVTTDEAGQGVVTEAYLMYVGSDKSRFETGVLDGSYSLDFVQYDEC